MERFIKLKGTAAPIRIANVDTDMIIPAHWLKTVKRSGLGRGLFQKDRYHDDGSENPDFVLNTKPYRGASIIVADDNFGCGSSREHAVWALLDFGIRCVISTAFGEIFYNNCFKNGVLPICVPKGDLDTLFAAAEHNVTNQLEIHLEEQEIRVSNGRVLHFDIDPFRKHCLLNGLDDIALTEQRQSEIDSFEERATTARPWA